MYRFEKLVAKHGDPIEYEIVSFLNFYDISKENIVNIRIVDNNHAIVIFDTKGSKFDGSSFDGTEWRLYY